MHYKKLYHRNLYFLVCIAFMAIQGCMQSNVYEKNITLGNNKWAHKNMPVFEFEITDTASNYLVYFTIRHTDAYPFSNIWMNVHTTMPGATQAQVLRTEVPLAEEDGKWMGKTFNEICSQQLLLTKDGTVHFNKKGKYKVKIEQIMRQDPLPEILSVGLRLEKVVNPN